MALDPQRQRLAEWMATPKAVRQPSARAALAEEIGCASSSLSRWVLETDVIAESTRLIQASASSPEKLEAIYAALFRAATGTGTNGRVDVKAAQVYLQATGLLQQAQTVIVRNAEVLTDEELNALLSERASMTRASDTLAKPVPLDLIDA
jgi:hypothetical protein